MRCFVGIPLPANVIGALVRTQATLREANPAWHDEKWVPAENLHITLHFLGEIDEAAIPQLVASIGSVADSAQAFRLELAELRATPSPARCGMIWAVFGDPDGACAELATRIATAAQDFGVMPDRRPFRAHVTLCRARRPRRLDSASLTSATMSLRVASDSMSVPSISVYSSRLTPRGPIYATIGSWRLRGE